MITVTLYTRQGCSLCEQAKTDLEALQARIPHRLVEIDVDSDDSFYATEVPVIEAGPYRLKAPFTRQDLQVTLSAAADRQAALEQVGDADYARAVAQGQTITLSDRISYWISRHYLLVINLFLALYVGLPFLAPVLKKAGADWPAEIIYRIYRPLCHQLAFRAWFLFGEQPFYPRAEAGFPNMITFEEATGITAWNDPSLVQARHFEGNPRMGYKVALCQRDVAIWGAMLPFGLLYSLTGRRIKPLPMGLWILFGILPAALDGGTQLLSQMPIPAIQALLPFRESTPFLRTLSGFLFGFLTAWFGLPVMEESMAETRRLLTKKFAVLKQ